MEVAEVWKVRTKVGSVLSVVHGWDAEGVRQDELGTGGGARCENCFDRPSIVAIHNGLYCREEGGASGRRGFRHDLRRMDLAIRSVSGQDTMRKTIDVKPYRLGYASVTNY